MREPAFFDNVLIVGVGLMGGSLGLTLREKGLAREVVGYDRNPENLETALTRNLIHTATTNLLTAVATADLIVFATPVSTIPPTMDAIATAIPLHTLLTDLGSTKQEITTHGERLFGERFVGGHPMAGAEESGAGAARANLFDNATWILTSSYPESEATQKVATWVSHIGANPVTMPPKEHDTAVALVSHLPHLLSFSFSGTVRGTLGWEQASLVSAGSYRDMMRVSYSNPSLWADILHSNREALLRLVEEYESRLHALRAALDQPEKALLEECLKRFGAG